MYQGKYSFAGKQGSRQKTERKRRLRWRSEYVVLCSILVLLSGIIGGTIAFLTDKTDATVNRFTYNHVTCEVAETFDNNIKSDVTIRNTGDTDAYIRAEIVVTWQNENGEIYGKQPAAGEDYAITYGGNGWSKGGDGYWYCTGAIEPGNITPELIERCTQELDGPEGYTLSVEILADAIQSKPADAVMEAWNVSVADNGTISK